MSPDNRVTRKCTISHMLQIRFLLLISHPRRPWIRRRSFAICARRCAPTTFTARMNLPRFNICAYMANNLDRPHRPTQQHCRLAQLRDWCCSAPRGRRCWRQQPVSAADVPVSVSALVQGLDQLTPLGQYAGGRKSQPGVFQRGGAHAAPQVRVAHQCTRRLAELQAVVLDQVAIDAVTHDLLRPARAIERYDWQATRLGLDQHHRETLAPRTQDINRCAAIPVVDSARRRMKLDAPLQLQELNKGRDVIEVIPIGMPLLTAATHHDLPARMIHKACFNPHSNRSIPLRRSRCPTVSKIFSRLSMGAG